jgi:hypothetical protein
MLEQNKHRRRLRVTLVVLGAAGVIYGMVRENNPVFVLGILIGVAGYLLVRRELRDSIKEKR